jgi:hypothetical protein
MSLEMVGSLGPDAALEPDDTKPMVARRRARVASTPTWLLRITVESFLIVMSILAALAVENWREQRGNHRLAVKSLLIFEREMRQNLALLDNNAPFHNGMHELLTQAHVDPEHEVDLASVIGFVEALQQEQNQQSLLRNTAWQTALATGALTHIDVETVSALSLTYSMQQRFVEESRASLPRLVQSVTISSIQQRSAVEETYEYVNDLVAAEQELRGFYKQALEIINNTLQAHPSPESVRDTAQT